MVTKHKKEVSNDVKQKILELGSLLKGSDNKTDDEKVETKKTSTSSRKSEPHGEVVVVVVGDAEDERKLSAGSDASSTGGSPPITPPPPPESQIVKSLLKISSGEKARTSYSKGEKKVSTASHGNAEEMEEEAKVISTAAIIAFTNSNEELPTSVPDKEVEVQEEYVDYYSNNPPVPKEPEQKFRKSVQEIANFPPVIDVQEAIAQIYELDDVETKEEAEVGVTKSEKRKTIKSQGKVEVEGLKKGRKSSSKEKEKPLKSYIQPSNFLKLMKTSMRYVPGINSQPNTIGHEDDPPYLFKTPGVEVLARKTSVDNLQAGGGDREKAKNAKEKVSYAPAFGLAWPTESHQPTLKTHQNMLASYLNYYSKKAEAEEAGFSGTAVFNPDLSISCAISCGMSPYPEKLVKGMKIDPLEYARSQFVQIPVPDLEALVKKKVRKPKVEYVPSGFVEKKDGVEIPDNYIEMQVPLFPDLGTQDIGIPLGAKAGFMDETGTFHEATAGDALPTGATIGYLNKAGEYQPVLNVEDGMQNGQIEYKEGFGLRPFIASADNEENEGYYLQTPGVTPTKLSKPDKFVSGTTVPVIGGQHYLAGIVYTSSRSPSPDEEAETQEPLEVTPSAPHTVTKIDPSLYEHFGRPSRVLPGDISQHQSQAVFVGVGEKKAHSTDQNHEIGTPGGKRKRKKRKKSTKIIQYEDEDGEMEEEEIIVFEEDDYDYSDILSDAGDEPRDKKEGESQPLSAEEEYREKAARASRASIRKHPSEAAGQRSSVQHNVQIVQGQRPSVATKQQTAPVQRPSFLGHERHPPPTQRPSVSIQIQTEPWTGQDLAQVAPADSKVGYINQEGEFVEAKKGDIIPAHARPAFKDNRSGKVGELEPIAKPPVVIEVAKIGYLNESGNFVEVQPGEGVPPNVVLGSLDENAEFQATQNQYGYLDELGKFIELDVNEKSPEGTTPGFLDHDKKFRPKPAKAGYKEKNGAFVELKVDDVPPPGVVLGYIDVGGSFVEEKQIPAEAVYGTVENGVFRKLSENEKPPPGVAPVYKQVHADGTEEIIPLQDPTKGFFDSNGVLQQTKPEIRKKSIVPPDALLGYYDKNGTFQKLGPGEKIPRGTPIGYIKNNEFTVVSDGGEGSPVKQKQRKVPPKAQTQPKVYVENPNEIVEVEIHDENDLDENGHPKVKVVLRHRGSVAPPKEAKEVEGEGLVWIEGNEQVTELTFEDENDLDENGKPKVKKMRVRKPLESEVGPSSRVSIRGKGQKGKGRQGRRSHPPRPGDPDYDSYYADEDDENLREAPLTEEERLRLVEFQRSISVQCELDFIEGSLDLGEVLRKSFRIYSHGGSIDIQPSIDHPIVHEEAPPVKHNMETTVSGNIIKTDAWQNLTHAEEEELEEAEFEEVKKKGKNIKKPAMYPGPGR